MAGLDGRGANGQGNGPTLRQEREGWGTQDQNQFQDQSQNQNQRQNQTQTQNQNQNQNQNHNQTQNQTQNQRQNQTQNQPQNNSVILSEAKNLSSIAHGDDAQGRRDSSGKNGP